MPITQLTSNQQQVAYACIAHAYIEHTAHDLPIAMSDIAMYRVEQMRSEPNSKISDDDETKITQFIAECDAYTAYRSSLYNIATTICHVVRRDHKIGQSSLHHISRELHSAFGNMKDATECRVLLTLVNIIWQSVVEKRANA